MKFLRPICSSLFLCCIFYAGISFCQVPKSSVVTPSVISNASHSLTSSEQIFIENKGQLADQFGKLMPEVLYSSDSRGMKCYLTDQGLHFVFSRVISPAEGDLHQPAHGLRVRATGKNDTLILQRLDMTFDGANPHPRIEAQNMADGYYNFYLAHCKLTGVRGYKKIIYHDLYPHIDFVIYSSEASSEYDFIVHPGGDPNIIAMRYSGMDSIQTSSDGRFKVFTPLGTLEEAAPKTYQQNDVQIPIASHFIFNDNVLRFGIGKYDKSLDLIIDPLTRMFGTYFGGSVLDIGQSPVVDKGNNIIFCGITKSTAGIASSGSYQTSLAGMQDIFMAKFTPSGALAWATYFGGSQNEFSGGMAIDSNNFLILYGETESNSGIATANVHQNSLSGLADVFLAKFDDNGSIQWSTYFGGDAGETVVGNRSVACDRGGHIYITGSTFSHNGLVTPGAWDSVIFLSSEDCFLAKFNSDDTLLWATYYGGSSDDHGWAVTTDSYGHVYLGGGTSSITNVATSTGSQSVYGGGNSDAFLAKFTSGGGLNWATYYGGSGDDYLTGLCTDSAGNIYGCGYTASNSGIATAGAFQQNPGGTVTGDDDGFIFKFDPTGKRQWGTYFGGTKPDFAEDIVSNAKELLISGESNSPTGISTPKTYKDSLQLIITQLDPTHLDTTIYKDAFIARFNFSGSRIWSTYYGGLNTDYGYGCALDQDDNVILVGETQSTDNIASAGSYQSIGGGIPTNLTNNDAFLVKLCDLVTPVLSGVSDTICVDGTDTLRLNQGYEQIDWFDGNTSLASAKDSLFYIIASPQKPGQHSIYVHVSNGVQCDAYTDTINYFVEAPPVADAGNDTAVCAGSSVQLKATIQGGTAPYKYLWNPTVGLSDPKKPNPIATPPSTTKYFVTVTDKFGCVATDSVILTMNPPPQINPNLQDTICAGKFIVIGDSASGAKAPYIYKWLPRAGLSTDDIATPIASPKATTTYTESVTDGNGCSSQKMITVTVNTLPIPLIAGPTAACVNSTEFYHNVGIGKGTYNWTLSGGGTLNNLAHPDSVSVLWQAAGKWILSLTVTNVQGCSADTTIAVTVGTTLTPVIIPNGTISFCSGDSVTLHASKGYTSYKWSDGSASDSLVVKQSGTFSVTVTSNGGCKGTSDSIIISENPSPAATITSDGPTHLCQGGSVHLDAGSGMGSYLWSTGETTQVITVTTAGSYTVQITNSFGCSATSLPIIVTVDANLIPVITPNGSLSFCQGDSVSLDAGSGYATYQWSVGGVSIPTATSEKFIAGASGSYTVAVTSGSCSGTSAPLVVTVFPLPTQPVISPSGSTLTSTQATTYQWLLNGQPLAGATNQSFTATLNGNYTVTITDANGCSNTSAPLTFGVNATATVAVGAVSNMNPGAKLEVPIELLASQNLIPINADHYTGTLRYNGTMLVPTGSSGGTIGTSNAVSGSTDRTIDFQGNSSPMTSGILQKIQFDATLGNDTCTDLTIDTFYWTDATVAVTRESGAFCESGICFADGGLRLINPTGTFGISPIHPNPASSHIYIDYDLIETGRTQLTLSDALGRNVRIIQEGEGKAGHYSIDIPLEDIATGYYQLLLKTPSQIIGRSFVVQK